MTETLLEITQEILTKMDGDEVNSIEDTEESSQVASIVVNAFQSYVSNRDWLHTRRGLTLIPSSDSNYPTHITLNDNVRELSFVNYDCRDSSSSKRDYREMKWKAPDDFLRLLNRRDSTASDVDIIEDTSGIELLIKNDKQPEYFTSFDDTVLIFDSYNSDVDATLQESKVQAQGFIIPVLSKADNAELDLPPDAVAGFKAEATSRCNYFLRQMQDPKSEQDATRQNRWLSRKAWRVNGGIKYPNYGRK